MDATAAPAAPTLPVSVVIPAYNRERLIGRAVDSALAQRPARPAEVIVVDDCSTDRTVEVARAHGARVVRHERNAGPAAARNTGVRAATEPWIGMLDSDDEWRPTLLAALWSHTGEDHVLVGGAGIARTADGAVEYYAGTHRRRSHVLRSPAELAAYGNIVGPSSTLVRRSAVEAIGGSREDMPLGTGQDLDLWIRLLEHGTGCLVPAVVALYHLDGDGAGAVQRDRQLMRAAHLRQAAAHEGKSWWSPSVLARAEGVDELDRAMEAWRAGDRQRAFGGGMRLARNPLHLAGAAGTVLRRRICMYKLRRLTA
jgi:glycosyltransferase involved in cell wall biosynthesis